MFQTFGEIRSLALRALRARAYRFLFDVNFASLLSYLWHCLFPDCIVLVTLSPHKSEHEFKGQPREIPQHLAILPESASRAISLMNKQGFAARYEAHHPR